MEQHKHMSSTEIFDLAFSFAGEDREYVESVKVECEKLGLSVYYDQDRKIDQWGKNFIEEQRKVYSGYKTKHFVPFISDHYFVKPIPSDEFKSALMESTKRNQYILPVQIGSANIPVESLHKDTQYLQSEEYTHAQLAAALKYVVDRGQEKPKNVDQLLEDELNLAGPKVTPRSYSKFEEAEELIGFLTNAFRKHIAQIKSDGYAPAVRGKDDSLMVRVERDGKTLFVMNLFFSAMGDNRLGFNFDQNSMMANAQSENGGIEPTYDKETQKAGYILTDFGYGSSDKVLSRKEVMEYFWSRMNEELERAEDRNW